MSTWETLFLDRNINLSYNFRSLHSFCFKFVFNYFYIIIFLETNYMVGRVTAFSF